METNKSGGWGSLVLIGLLIWGGYSYFHKEAVPEYQPSKNYEASLPVLEEYLKSEPKCHPSYSGCLNPDASDYDCVGGSGNGPYYTGRVRVIGPDVFGLDRDGDGIGCE